MSTLRRTSSVASAGMRSCFRRSILNDEVFSLDVSMLAETLAQRLDAGHISGRKPPMYPIRGTFVGCCAATGRLSAKSKAQSARRLMLFPKCFTCILLFLPLCPLLYARGVRSPNHLIRPRQDIRGNRHADLLGGFQIDDELKLRRLLDGNVAGLSAFQDLVDKVSGAPA